MNYQELLPEGIKQKLLVLEDEGRYVVYSDRRKRRNYENPEEKVQAEAYLRLVLVYKYPPHRIRVYQPVQMGSERKEADIIVYADNALTVPLIVVECKHPEVS